MSDCNIQIASTEKTIEKNSSAIPDVLYKYREINEYALSMLSKGELYFAHIKELDDPNEQTYFQYTFGTHHVNRDNQIEWLCEKEQTKLMSNAIRGDDRYGIFSLCSSRQEKRMYEEYAKNFAGICIGFDWNNFGLFVPNSYPPETIGIKPLKVKYADPIKINYGERADWIEVMTTKATTFSYEKEYRIIYNRGACSSKKIRESIREIVFGYNVSAQKAIEIKSLVSDLNDVNFYKAILEKDTVKILPINI